MAANHLLSTLPSCPRLQVGGVGWFQNSGMLPETGILSTAWC